VGTLWQALLGVGVGLLGMWLALVGALLWAGRRYARPALSEILRLLPDLLRLLRGLATDRELPRGVRIRLWLLLVYLAVPLDLIPDFVPLIGYADDAVIVALVLRSGGGPALMLCSGTGRGRRRDWPSCSSSPERRPRRDVRRDGGDWAVAGDVHRAPCGRGPTGRARGPGTTFD
jgi:hypothetical protein